jgi:two-component sensor histidine kinase
MGETVVEQASPLFAGIGGQMAARVRSFDWASRPLGPLSDWPVEVKSAVGVMLESGFPTAIVLGPSFVTLYNDAFLPILGAKPDALGRSFAEVWSEVWPQIGTIAERALAGEATFREDMPLVIQRAEGSEKAWFTFSYSPLRLADGTVAGFVDTVCETTAGVQAREQVELLNHELGHRLKNTLAMVQALAIQTLRNTGDREAIKAFHERIAALGHAHDVLLQRNWSAAGLEPVIKAALGPLDGLGQVELDGPDVETGAQFTIALSLVLHELGVNAVKYGALSRPDGRVRLSWRLDGERLRMAWRETGGPPVAPPSRNGFGSRLIDRGFGGGGRVERRYPPAGFEADFELPGASYRPHG